MSAINSLPARNGEKLAAVCEVNRVRLEELETRMLMSRGALQLLSPLPSETVEVPSVETSVTVIVVRESAEIIVETESEPIEELPAELLSLEPAITIEPARIETTTEEVTESVDSIVQSSTEPTTSTTVSRIMPGSVDSPSTSSPSNDVVVPETSTVLTSEPTVVRRSTETSDTASISDTADETTATSEPVAPVVRRHAVVERPAPTGADNNIDPEPKTELVPTPAINRRVAVIDDPPQSQPVEPEPEPVIEPAPIAPPVFLRRVIVVTEPVDKPVDEAEPDPKTEPPVSRRIDVEPGDESDQSDISEEPKSEAPIDEVSEGDDTPSAVEETDQLETAEPAISCGMRTIARAGGDSCSSTQLAVVTVTAPAAEAASEAVSTTRDSAETIDLLATESEEAIAEFLSPNSESTEVRVGSAASDSAPDQLSSAVIPEDALADALASTFAENPIAVNSEIGDGMVVAGVFAVALAKPLSRLSLPDSSSLSNGSQPIALPFAFGRRRRGARSSKPETKDNPDKPDEDSPQRSGDSDGHDQSHDTSRNSQQLSDSNPYDTYEAAILSFLPFADHDDSDDPATRYAPFSSARSLAAGALAAATAFFTLQGSQTPKQNRLRIQPLTPSYRGMTEAAPN